jgi:K+-sensing histidine kinase KdpD
MIRWAARLEAFARDGLPPGSLLAYLFAAGCAGAAALAHIAFLQFTSEITPSIFYNSAVFAATLIGGIGAGLTATGLCVLFLWYIFNWLYSMHQITTTVSPIINCALYLVAAVVIVLIADRYRAIGRYQALRAKGSSPRDSALAEHAPFASARISRAVREWYRDPHPNALAGYILAATCIAIATFIRLGFGWLGGELLPLVSYYPGILLASLVGGAGAGVFAMILSLIAVWFAFPTTAFSFSLLSREETVGLSVYVFVSLFSIWLAESHRTARANVRKSPTLKWVTPILVAFAGILLTTFVLLAIDAYLRPDHLVLGYLLPTVVIAMHYGSTLAVLTCFAGGLASAYFLFPPKFSFYISDPFNVAELGFFLLLAVIASKAAAAVTDDIRMRNAPRHSGRPA